MRKRIVLSVDDNPEYLFYIPLVCWAWRKLEWEPLVFFVGRNDAIMQVINECFKKIHEGETAEMRLTLYGNKWFPVDKIEGYKPETIAQISRLYGACVAYENDYLMTGDIDMLPLSDYWQPNENRITCWGHDLTSFQHYPICYIGMSCVNWIKTMKLTTDDQDEMIARDLAGIQNAKIDSDPVKRWVVDQDFITEKLNNISGKLLINRGTLPNGYPIGRVDRSAWTLEHHLLIDCHMLRGIYKSTPEGVDNFGKTLRLLYKCWPHEDFTWFSDYTKKFQTILNA